MNLKEELPIPYSDNYFAELAAYYDVTHQWRDYGRQARFLVDVLKKKCPNATKILDLACGTGEHALRLSSASYEVVGIDCSDAMLAIAKDKSRFAPQKPQWLVGDIFTLENVGCFDAAYCLGLTIHYMLSLDRMRSFLKRVRSKLEPAGLLVFDIINPWRLVAMKPTNFYVSEDEKCTVYILERSEIDHSLRIRRNDYIWFVQESGKIWQQYKLYENLKIWFVDELHNLLETVGFEVLTMCSEYDLQRLDLEKDFNVGIVARKGMI